MDSDFAAAIERDMRFNPFLKDALSEIGLFIATRQINRSSTNTDIHIPADIIEIILDFLLDDVKSLGKCALVHRSWTTLCRHRLFSVITMHSDTDVPLMVEQLKAISDTHTREVRVEGMCRSNRYLWTRGDKMTYQHLAELSKLFPEGIPILTLSRSNLFFPDLSTVVSESLSTETLEAARLFLFKVQTLRFDFTEWLLSEDFQALVTDCVNATRLVLFNSCPPKALSMRSPLACTMKAAPLSRLKHLELVGLGSSFRRRKGADRLGKIFQWLVPDSTGTHLQTFTCVLVDVFIIHAWETFIGTSGRYIRTLRVSFVYDHENAFPADWLPDRSGDTWKLRDLAEIDIVANKFSVICMGHLLQALESPQLETVRLRLAVGAEWTHTTRTHVQMITQALRGLRSVKHVLVQTPDLHSNMKRLFTDEERRGTFVIHFDHRPFEMDPFAEPNLHPKLRVE